MQTQDRTLVPNPQPSQTPRALASHVPPVACPDACPASYLGLSSLFLPPKCRIFNKAPRPPAPKAARKPFVLISLRYTHSLTPLDPHHYKAPQGVPTPSFRKGPPLPTRDPDMVTK